MSIIYNYVNTESAIDFVTGPREHLLNAQKDPVDPTGESLNDVMFAQDSGTIIVGDVEYGAYYPGDSVSPTATNNQVGKLLAGHSRSYFLGRPIRDILDEILFVTPSNISITESSLTLTLTNSKLIGQAYKLSTLPTVYFTITNSEGLSSNDCRNMKINGNAVVVTQVNSTTCFASLDLKPSHFITGNTAALAGTISNGEASGFVDGFDSNGDYYTYGFNSISKNFTATLTGTVKGKEVNVSKEYTLAITKGSRGKNADCALSRPAIVLYGFSSAVEYVAIGALKKSYDNLLSKFKTIKENEYVGFIKYDTDGTSFEGSNVSDVFTVTTVTSPGADLTTYFKGTKNTDSTIDILATAADWVTQTVAGTVSNKPILSLVISNVVSGTYKSSVKSTFAAAQYNSKKYLCDQCKLRSEKLLPEDQTGELAQAGSVTTRYVYPYYPVSLLPGSLWSAATSTEAKLLANKSVVGGPLKFTFKKDSYFKPEDCTLVGYIMVNSSLHSLVNATVKWDKGKDTSDKESTVNFPITLESVSYDGNPAIKVTMSNVDSNTGLVISGMNALSGTVNISFN